MSWRKAIWCHIPDRLYAPDWCFEIRNVTTVGDRCVVIASITIPCREGQVTRQETGCEDDELRGYGDPSSNSEAMALKRAAAKFAALPVEGSYMAEMSSVTLSEFQSRSQHPSRMVGSTSLRENENIPE